MCFCSNGWVPLKRTCFIAPQKTLIRKRLLRYSKWRRYRRRVSPTVGFCKRRRLSFKQRLFVRSLPYAWRRRRKHFQLKASAQRLNTQAAERPESVAVTACYSEASGRDERLTTTESSGVSRCTDTGVILASNGENNEMCWNPILPVFKVNIWEECPANENIMDVRTGGRFVINVTTGWAHRRDHVIQHFSQFGRCEAGRSINYGTNFQPAVGPSLESYGSNLGNSIVSAHINVRCSETLRLEQQLHVPTNSINCIDGGRK